MKKLLLSLMLILSLVFIANAQRGGHGYSRGCYNRGYSYSRPVCRAYSNPYRPYYRPYYFHPSVPIVRVWIAGYWLYDSYGYPINWVNGYWR